MAPNISPIQDALWCVNTQTNLYNLLLQLFHVSNTFLYIVFQESQILYAKTFESRILLMNCLKHWKDHNMLTQVINPYTGYRHFWAILKPLRLSNLILNVLFATRLKKETLISPNMYMILQQKNYYHAYLANLKLWQ